MSKPPRCLRTIDQGTTQAPTSFAQVDPSAVGVKDALPMEFLNPPMQQETALDEIQHEVGVEQVFMTINIDDSKIRFRKSLHQWEISSNQIIPPARNSHDDQAVRLRLRSRVHACQPGIADDEPKACDSSEVASHGSLGIVDLGATKTVIGSKLVRKQVTRCPCVVTFRFGNHGVLRSQQALVVPIPGLLLKTAVVQGNTPFLLSNTLLRAIGATVDTANHVLHATKLDKSFPLVLTSRGLFFGFD